jgi:hypothetical protein
VQGALRINIKKPTDAYVPGGKLFRNDILISGMIDRNRALDTDLVVVEPKPREEWIVLGDDIMEKGFLAPIVYGDGMYVCMSVCIFVCMCLYKSKKPSLDVHMAAHALQ